MVETDKLKHFKAAFDQISDDFCTLIKLQRKIIKSWILQFNTCMSTGSGVYSPWPKCPVPLICGRGVLLTHSAFTKRAYRKVTSSGRGFFTSPWIFFLSVSQGFAWEIPRFHRLSKLCFRPFRRVNDLFCRVHGGFVACIPIPRLPRKAYTVSA